MRLAKLDAQFIGHWSPTGYRRQVSIVGAQGLLFQCPACAVGKEYGEEEDPIVGHRGFWRGAHYIICWFRNPRDADPVPPEAVPNPGRWWITGESIEDLSFVSGEPPMAHSVLLTGPGCGWHGFVTNGDAT